MTKKTHAEWQDIATAPKEVSIMLYADGGEMFVAFWGVSMETGEGSWVTARANDGTCFLLHNPTHWMPLPQPPHIAGM